MICRCADHGYRSDMSYQEVRQFVRDELYCTSLKHKGYQIGLKGYICPTIASRLRTFDAVLNYHEQRRKQLKKEGYTEPQIEEKLKQTRRRSSKKVIAPKIDFNFETLETKTIVKKKRRGIAYA